MHIPIRSALISVFSKQGLEPVIRALQLSGVRLYSTGGTQAYLEQLGAEVTAVEQLTDYPSILGGRVKTLHPKIFGGILARRDNQSDTAQLDEYDIPEFDLVVVDLYPFEETLAESPDPHGAGRDTIIEKIDIGGISLIRAAAKNHCDVLVCASRFQYSSLLEIIQQKGGSTLDQRRKMAALAFDISSRYDTAIQQWFEEGLRIAGDTDVEFIANGSESQLQPSLNIQIRHSRTLRYGENPHQQGRFYGNLDDAFEQLSGKALSYNNLVDLDSAADIIREFGSDEPTFAILKHTNTCGLATRPRLSEAYQAALGGDPLSAFGGVLIANRTIEMDTASLIHELFCEIVVAPDYAPEAIELLRGKKNRILLLQKQQNFSNLRYRSLLNGALLQHADRTTESASDLKVVTKQQPTEDQIRDLLFALKAVKHLKSNAIALAAGQQLIGMGAGQTSRIDALQQAVDKAKRNNFDTANAVLASDAFFPFADAVELAAQAGIKAIAQPGGSVKDQDSIDFCDGAGIAMVFTSIRHFKH